MGLEWGDFNSETEIFLHFLPRRAALVRQN
jgi:hypothetical protein